MPRPERPLDARENVVAGFAAELRRLRELAGSPGYRELAQRAHYSLTTLSQAAGGRKFPSLAVALAYVQACGGDVAEWEGRWRAVVAQLASANSGQGSADAEDVTSPYVGLAAFGPQDADRFFGRERLVGLLMARLAERRCVVAVGASGSGKSSVLRAGLIPAVRDSGLSGGEGWPVVLLTPGVDPLHECAVRIGAVLGRSAGPLRAEIAADPANLDLAVRQALADRADDVELVVVVDQFEEVFTVCADGQERSRFLAALLGAAQAPRSRMRVVLGVRADFYAACTRQLQLVEALQHGQVLVGPMSVDELRRAITQPAVHAGCTIEGALLARLVADAAGRPGVLPLLAHALLETWRRRRGNALTLAGYEAAGGIQGALAKTAEAVYAGFSDGQQRLARQIFLRLAALGDGTEDTKRRIARAELDADDPDVCVVLEAMAQARLLMLGEGTVELTHEALIGSWPRLRGWLDEDREGLRLHRELADAARAWADLDRDNGALYRGTRLAAARDWADKSPDMLTPHEQAFLTASSTAETADRRSAHRRARQLRRLAGTLAALLLVSIGVSVIAIGQRQDALAQRREVDEQRRVATSRELAAQAQSELGSDVGNALRLALQAWQTAPTTEARSALLSLSSRPAYHARLPLNGPAPIAISPDAQLAAVLGPNGATVWDLPARAQTADLSLRPGMPPPSAIAFGPDGHLAVISGDELVLWDAHRRRQTQLRHGHRGNVQAMAFDPDGRYLATIGDDHTIRLWNTADNQQTQTLDGSGGARARLAFSTNGRLLASAGDDGKVVIWDLTTRARVAAIPVGSDPLQALVFSPDGQILATAGPADTVSLWQADTGVHLADLHSGAGLVTGLVFDHAGGTLVSTNLDGSVVIWDVPLRAQLIRLPTGESGGLTAVAMGSDGTIAAASPNAILFWNPAQLPFIGPTGSISSLTYGVDGQHVTAIADDNVIRTWDASRKRPIQTAAPASDRRGLTSAAVSPNHQRLAIYSDSGLVSVYDTASHQRLAQLPSQAHSPTSLAFSLDGSRLAIWDSSSSAVGIWNVDKQQRISEVPRWSTGTITAMAFHPDGQRLAMGTESGLLALGDTGDGHHTAPRIADRSPTTAIAFHPSGRLLATTTGDSIQLWDLTQPQPRPVDKLHAHAGRANDVAFSPDGRLLATAGRDHKVTVWDVETRTLWATLTGHTDAVTSLAWRPDSNALLTGAADHTITEWTINTNQATTDLCHRLPDLGQPPPRPCTNPPPHK